jgi:hypothetical protein
MSFVVRRPSSFGTALIITDMGFTLDSGEERDLLENNDYSTDEINGSADLAAQITGGGIERLDGFGGSVIPASQAFDDSDLSSHIGEAFPHHPHANKAQIDAISDAGSGIVISAGERSKLSGIEAGAEVNDTGAEILAKLQGETPPLALNVDELEGNSAADLLDRANHTGTQLASTISDFDSAADARIAAQKGAANGIAELDASGRVPASQLTVSAFEFKGNWNANTNTPALASGVGTQGDLYRVSVAGTTNLDGITDWQVGDQAIFDGTAWVKQDGSDAVTSVNGQQGAVVLDTDDVGEGSTSLYYTDARVAAAPAVVANTAKVSADGSINTHSDVDISTNPPTLGQLLSWNGVEFVPTDPAAAEALVGFQARQTVGLAGTGSFQSFDLDTVDVESDPSVIARDPVNISRVVFKEPGTYWCIYSADVTVGSGATGQIRALQNGTTPIAAADRNIDGAFGTSSAAITAPFILTTTVADEYIEIQGVTNSGTVDFEATLVQAIALRAAKGEKGDPGTPGSGSTVNVEDDGVLVPNSPFSILNFIGFDSVSDAGGGQVDITAPVVEDFGYIYYGKSANQTFSSTVTVNFDRLIRNTAGGDFTVNTVSGGVEVTCNFDGWVELSYDVSITVTTNSRETSRSYVEQNTGGGFSTVSDSDAWGYHRQISNGQNTVSVSALPIQVSTGDILRVRSNDETSGTLDLLANGCRLKIERTD